eukprot:Gb_18920 [translate_table: standard]
MFSLLLSAFCYAMEVSPVAPISPESFLFHNKFHLRVFTVDGFKEASRCGVSMACTWSHLPVLDLSHILARDDSLKVSFVSTLHNISRIKRLLEPEQGHIDLVELPLPSLEGLPHGAKSTADVRVLK